MKYGRLTLVEYVGPRDKWRCVCDCGQEVTRGLRALKHGAKTGRISSCGCRMIGHRAIDRTGERYGALVAVRRAEVKDKAAGYYWVFRCDCGNEIVRMGNQVARHSREGHWASCGCQKPDRRPPGVSARISRYRAYRDAARDRGLIFELTEKQMDRLFAGKCHYCGIPPSRKTTTKFHGSFTYNGIDRVDNNIGYVIGNCVSCCWTCNRKKGSMPYNEFVSWLDRIAHFRNGGS